MVSMRVSGINANVRINVPSLFNGFCPTSSPFYVLRRMDGRIMFFQEWTSRTALTRRFPTINVGLGIFMNGFLKDGGECDYFYFSFRGCFGTYIRFPRIREFCRMIVYAYVGSIRFIIN